MRIVVGLIVACLVIGCGNGSGGGGGAGGGGGGGTGGAGGGGAGGGGGGGGAGGAGGGGSYDFPQSSTIYQDISNAPVDSESASVMGALQTIGWGDNGAKMRVDVSFAVLTADASVTPRPFTSGSTDVDCDTAPIPVPPGGRIEGKPTYDCTGGDCHLLVYQGARLYELYQARITGGMATGGTFTGNCLVVWDLTKDYWANPATVGAGFSRGDGCNGADAADLPMAALILKTSDIQAGVINHALRFTIGNERIRADVYVHPATHLGGPTGDATTMPYGSRLRLKASFDESTLPSDAARVVARALKKYGMFMADGGNPYISATDDIDTVISPNDLTSLEPQDFEMIDGGTRIDFHQQNCTRTPITQ